MSWPCRRRGWLRMLRALRPRAAGWTLYQGPQGRDGRGAASAGVAIIADVPAQQVELPTAMTHDGRLMALKVGRVAPCDQHLPACRRQGPWQPHCAGRATRGRSSCCWATGTMDGDANLRAKLDRDLDELAGTFPDLPRANGFDIVADYTSTARRRMRRSAPVMRAFGDGSTTSRTTSGPWPGGSQLRLPTSRARWSSWARARAKALRPSA